MLFESGVPNVFLAGPRQQVLPDKHGGGGARDQRSATGQREAAASMGNVTLKLMDCVKPHY